MDIVRKLQQLVTDAARTAVRRVVDPFVQVASDIVHGTTYERWALQDGLRAALTDIKAGTVGLSDETVSDVPDLTAAVGDLLFRLDRDVNVMGQLEKKSLAELRLSLDKLLKERREQLLDHARQSSKTPQEYVATMERAKQITRALEQNLSGQVIEVLRPIARSSGNPDRLDSAQELWQAARLFAPRNNPVPEIRRFQQMTDQPYNGVDSKFRIKPEDADTYLELRRMMPAIHKELGIAQVHHPLAEFAKRLPLLGLDQWRSLQVFDGYAHKLGALLDKTGNRHPTLLYPASGNHYAPLQTMMRLVDLGKADSVTLIGTELEFNRYDMVQTLKALKTAGVIEGFEAPSPTPMSFAKGGSEQVFKMHYRGKPITIEMAIGRSGDDYFLPEHFKRATGVIIHDPDSIHAANTYRLLSTMTAAQQRAGDRADRLIVMEGTPSANYLRGFELGYQLMTSNPQLEQPTLGVVPELISGAYGHCKDTGSSSGVGEVFACAYGGAYVFNLNDDRFHARIADARTPNAIFGRIYHFRDDTSDGAKSEAPVRCSRWK